MRAGTWTCAYVAWPSVSHVGILDVGRGAYASAATRSRRFFTTARRPGAQFGAHRLILLEDFSSAVALKTYVKYAGCTT
jgi:hypothetical protein